MAWSTSLLVSSVFLRAISATALPSPESPSQTPSSHVRVPVILGVMSRCPDAILCESVFDDVIKSVGSKMSLELTFIAKHNSSDVEFGATCLHGPYECAGNVHELCAAHVLPRRSEWWSFIQCLNSKGRYEVGYEDVSRNCADKVGIDWNHPGGLKECIHDGTGVDLLHQSIDRSVALGITKSCTILINGKTRCIRDGTWYDCDDGHSPEDFARTINEEYEKLNAGPKSHVSVAGSSSQSVFQLPGFRKLIYREI